MTENQAPTWLVYLDVLTPDRAAFAAKTHDTTFAMARGDWEAIGRPSAISVTPRKYEEEA